MKACTHFRSGRYDTEIVESNGYPWNAWVNEFDGYRLVSSQFRAGLRWDYLYHLRDNKECRRQVRLTKKEVDRMLKQMNKEWEGQ